MSNSIYNSNKNDNITFFFEEKNDCKNNEEEIQKMMEEFTSLNESIQDEMTGQINSCFKHSNMEYFLRKGDFDNNELFYEQEYTVKELLKICSYYGLDKDIRSSKCKKQDIISTIVYFESLSENFNIVQKRNNMWAFIYELLNDQKMKKFIIWN